MAAKLSYVALPALTFRTSFCSLSSDLARENIDMLAFQSYSERGRCYDNIMLPLSLPEFVV